MAVCDIQLPDGDGVKLLRQLHRINPAIFVLIISAYATVENAVEAFTAGAFDYLVKPVRFEELTNRLQRLFKFQDLYRAKTRSCERTWRAVPVLTRSSVQVQSCRTS